MRILTDIQALTDLLIFGYAFLFFALLICGGYYLISNRRFIQDAKKLLKR